MSTVVVQAPTVDLRLAALRRFSIAISALTVIGHLFLGFEQAYAHVVVALATTYGVEILLEAVDAAAHGRSALFRGGVGKLVDFLLPAHITGLACAMLLYPGDRLWPVAFAGAFAIASKALLQAPVRGRMRHFLNPSNAGIALTLVLFPSVGIAPPYQFLENLHGIADWILPLVIVATGTLLNAKLTKRIPLIGAWLLGFGAQAVVRSLVMGTPMAPTLAPMTGVAFVLFTFYMISDPGTTPAGRREQVIFGLATAAVYSALQLLHVVFGLFFALAIVCVVRGAGLHAIAAREARARGRVLEPLPSMAEAPR